MSVFIDLSELYRKETLGKLCCDAEKCGNYHPEKRTGTACNDSCCNTDDISRSDSCGKCRTKRTEAADLSVTLGLVMEKIVERSGQLSYLEKAQPY